MDKFFTEEDINKTVEFINFIAVKAEFNGWKTEDTIKHFGLLSYMQKVIIEKMKDNLCEIKEVVEPKETKSTKKVK